jgi:hypothetical protein
MIGEYFLARVYLFCTVIQAVVLPDRPNIVIARKARPSVNKQQCTLFSQLIRRVSVCTRNEKRKEMMNHV